MVAALERHGRNHAEVHQLQLASRSRKSAHWPDDTQAFAKALVEFGCGMRQVGHDEAVAEAAGTVSDRMTQEREGWTRWK